MSIPTMSAPVLAAPGGRATAAPGGSTTGTAKSDGAAAGFGGMIANALAAQQQAGAATTTGGQTSGQADGQSDGQADGQATRGPEGAVASLVAEALAGAPGTGKKAAATGTAPADAEGAERAEVPADGADAAPATTDLAAQNLATGITGATPATTTGANTASSSPSGASATETVGGRAAPGSSTPGSSTPGSSTPGTPGHEAASAEAGGEPPALSSRSESGQGTGATTAPAPSSGTTATSAPAATVATTAPAAAAAPAASSAAEHSGPVGAQVFPEVGRLVTRGDGTQRLTLRLSPETLGDVRITVTVRAGTVDVSLAAGVEAQEALRDGTSDLRRLLETLGASTTQIVVKDLPSASSSLQPANAGTSTLATDAHGAGAHERRQRDETDADRAAAHGGAARDGAGSAESAPPDPTSTTNLDLRL